MLQFLIVIEKANNNYSAYSPDLPGCIATGVTLEASGETCTKPSRAHPGGVACRCRYGPTAHQSVQGGVRWKTGSGI